MNSEQKSHKPQLYYIELKSGYADNGPAWIGRVEFSKSGKSLYFNGRAFYGKGHGSCMDMETRDIYWISGIKKNGEDRHWAENGKIMIDKEVVEEYMKFRELEELDKKKYEIVTIEKTDKTKFHLLKNKNSKINSLVDKTC